MEEDARPPPLAAPFAATQPYGYKMAILCQCFALIKIGHFDYFAHLLIL